MEFWDSIAKKVTVSMFCLVCCKKWQKLTRMTLEKKIILNSLKMLTAKIEQLFYYMENFHTSLSEDIFVSAPTRQDLTQGQ